MSKGFFGLWLLLIGLWSAASSSLALETLGAGALISAALANQFSRKTQIWQCLSFSPARFTHFIQYTAAFFVELVRANIDLVRHIYSPRVDIRPSVIKVKTRLKSPAGRLALANSISLTPGSLVLGIEGDTLLVHCLDADASDPEEVANGIVRPFEHHLEQVFG